MVTGSGGESKFSTRRFGNLVYRDLDICEWEFDEHSGTTRVDGVEPKYRIYHTDRNEPEADAGSFYFCIIEIGQSEHQDIQADQQGTLSESTEVNVLIAGTAKQSGIYRTEPEKASMNFHGLPVEDFTTLCEILNSLKHEYCSDVE